MPSGPSVSFIALMEKAKRRALPVSGYSFSSLRYVLRRGCWRLSATPNEFRNSVPVLPISKLESLASEMNI